ncbi:glycosyltransferase family 39 protein [Phragmitibacter flavus]|uniref:Glycosyltransferase family 39 protein n=1 Tax=Phragmitibacter flavus TaxID=2576071 RepID=A0A5R8KLB4_9BACT|nr:glycosyltransferase family 39 protein [Phragmitibacter flavus]TLD72479.1 glycosyltransferase family 39 protein [Phragmitibacter flavus]
MNRQPYLLPALLLLTLARFLALDVIPVAAIETHALACAHAFDFWHTALGPIIPLLAKISTSIFGEAPFGIRFFSPLLILGASLLLWNLTHSLFDKTTASWTLVFFNLIPAVNLAAITLTPTTLGIFTSIVVLASMRVALHSQHPWHQPWWLLGLALVVAAMVDWRLSTLTLAALTTLLLTGRGRRSLLRWPILPILIGCLGFALTLFIAWNSEHHWAAFQSLPPDPHHTLTRSFFQILLLYSPLLLPAIAWAYMISTARKPMENPVGFLGAFSLTLIALDAIIWHKTPFPQAAFSTWLAPAIILLAHQTLHADTVRPRLMFVARTLVLFTAALTTFLLLSPPIRTTVGL